ncbi:hypothetical protein GGI09_006832, partial [Coemansia sp. S100]
MALVDKDHVDKPAYEMLQHAKNAKAETIAKAEEEYLAVLAEIHKSTETKEAKIAALKEKAEKQR